AREPNDYVIDRNLKFRWRIRCVPDNQIGMSERGGRTSRLNPATATVTPLLTISEVVSNNEGGLLGMVLHPDFTTTPQVFVVYDYNSGSNYREKVVRYTYTGTTLVNPVTLLDNIAASSIHNGSRLVITPDLKLF